jgi:hypothetical protein
VATVSIVPFCTAVPQRLAALPAFHRRRANEVASVLALVDVAGELEVLGHVSMKMSKPFRLASTATIEALLVGHVHDVKRRVDGGGPVDRPFVGFGFDEFRPRQVSDTRARPCLPLKNCSMFISMTSDFGVDIRHRADFLALSSSLTSVPSSTIIPSFL